MLRKAFAVLALIPLALGAGHQEEFEVLLEDMIEKVSPFRRAIRIGLGTAFFDLSGSPLWIKADE
jgi:hypothetical protein